MESINKIIKIIFLIPINLINNFIQFKKLAEVKQVQLPYIKWIFCIILSPLLLLFYIFVLLLRQFVSLVLFFKFKSKFGGILKNQDGGFALEYPQLIINDLIFLIESDKSPQEFYEMVKEHINKALRSKLAYNPKICGTLNIFFGYPYILRDEVNIDECITKLKRVAGETMTREDLLKINEEDHSELLPKTNKGFWQVLIGSQPVDWDKNSNKSDLKVYPVKLRFSHCLADGIHLVKGIFELFGDKEKDMPKETTLTRGPLSKLLICFQNLSNISKIFSMISVLLVNSILITSSPHDILHGKKLSGKKFMCVNREEFSNHLQIAKNIKKRFSNVALTDVFASAFSASLTEYFQKHASEIPKYITCVVIEGQMKVLSSSSKSKTVCKNNVGMYVSKLPTFVESKHGHIDFNKMFLNIAEQNKQIHESGEPEAFRWSTNTFTPNVPINITRLLTRYYDVHGTITNAPGPPLFKVMGGNLLKNIVVWSPNPQSTGIGLCILTYGGKSYMTLNIDSVLVPERKQVQEILDNIYKYMKLLDGATCKKMV